jgi:predicted AAA+ superfamily ATPase
MNNIHRTIQKDIEESLFKGKVIVIQGPRQVGKTTLAKELIAKYGNDKSYINCDIIANANAMGVQDSIKLREFLGEGKFFVIDEAQKVKNIGLNLKILVDTYPEIQIIATGSSSFALSAQIGEPLVGRMFKYILYPFSIKEMVRTTEQSSEGLGDLLVYGSYPDIITGKASSKIDYLTMLASNFLYKDIAGFEEIRNPELLRNLLELLAYQLGNEVSYNELANKLGVRRETILRYIYILEEAFIIFRLYPFSRNLRNEIGKKNKVYFYDLGVRNAIINKFESINTRTDLGALWENLCIIERKKQIQDNHWYRGTYFWRTTSKKEIDYIEDYDGKLYGFEFKWGNGDHVIPKEFLKAYEGSSGVIINRSNYIQWLTNNNLGI